MKIERITRVLRPAQPLKPTAAAIARRFFFARRRSPGAKVRALWPDRVVAGARRRGLPTRAASPVSACVGGDDRACDAPCRSRTHAGAQCTCARKQAVFITCDPSRNVRIEHVAGSACVPAGGVAAVAVRGAHVPARAGC
jgi:hypothetical protein